MHIAKYLGEQAFILGAIALGIGVFWLVWGARHMPISQRLFFGVLFVPAILWPIFM
jgi:hypothetical protein